MENNNVNFFAIPIFSFAPKKYKELVKEKGGKIFGVLLIVFILMAIVNAIVLHFGFNDVADTISEKCPNFVLVSGELSCDQVVDIDEDGVFIKIDCNTKGIDLDEFKEMVEAKHVQSAFYCGSESACIFSMGNGYQQINYSDLERSLQASGATGLAFSKDSLLNAILPIIEAVIIIAMILGAFFAIGFHYLLCLILKFITSIMCSMFNKNIGDKEKYRLTVLARFAVYFLMWFVELFVSIPASILVGLVLIIAYIAVIVKLYDDGSNDLYIEQNYSFVESSSNDGMY